MIKTKRLNILKLIKNKKLNNVSKEIRTLNDEIKKSRGIKDKLTNIHKNALQNNSFKNAGNIKHKHSFDTKIIQQISLCKNREIFLENELNLAKNKLGKLILQKNNIEDKIKLLVKQKRIIEEEKIEKNTPAFKNS